MTTIHVIYDPEDRVSTRSDVNKQFGLKTAHLSLANNINPAEIRTHAVSLVVRLMEQIFIDQGKL